jgi:CheY-like chemotaxis protein
MRGLRQQALIKNSKAKMLKLLIVEDDPFAAAGLRSQFKTEFREVEIKVVTSESQFLEDFKYIEQFEPDLIMLDIMLRWSNARINRSLAMPREIKSTSFYRAGFRCLKLLSESEGLKDVPVIIHSILGRDELTEELKDLPVNVFASEKSESQMKLFMYVRSMLQDLPEENLKKKSILSKLLASSEIKPGWFGIRIDLKTIFDKRK